NVIFSTEAESPDTRRLGQAARVSTLIALVLGFTLAAACPLAIPLLFGREFDGSVSVAWILIAAIVLSNPGTIAGAGLIAWGRPGLRSLALGIGAVINAVALVLLVPRFGALGAAAAILVGRVVAANITIVWLRTTFGVPMADFYRFQLSDVREISVQAANLLRRNAQKDGGPSVDDPEHTSSGDSFRFKKSG